MEQFRRRMRPGLGTYIDIGVDKQIGDQGIERAFSLIESLQKRLSRHDEESELSRLNRAEGTEFSLHPQTIAILRLARWITIASGRLFNCGVDNLKMSGRKVRLPAGEEVTLDGIAKGYAVDLAILELKKMGASAGWVNAGGDIKVFGDLTLPIHRRQARGYQVIGGLRNAAVATSEVSLRDDHTFPGKILSRDKRRPAIGTWTLLAKNAWLADALTKVASLACPLQRENLIDRLGGQLVTGGEV